MPSTGYTANDNRSELQAIQQNIAEKEQSVERQKQEKKQLIDKLKSQEKAIALASRKLRDIQNTLNAVDKEIEHLTKSVSQLQTHQKKQETLLADQLEAAFRLGKHNGLELLLSGEESQRGERILAYFGYLNEARQTAIAQLTETRNQLNAEKQQLLVKQSTQQRLLAQQKGQRQKLEEATSARQKTLRTLNASLEKDQAQLTELKQNQARLQDTIARAEREAREAQQIRDRETHAQRQGTTYKPTEAERALMSRAGGLGQPNGQAIWPVKGAIEHRFGEVMQGEIRWKGIVIRAPEGSEVKAIASGQVLMADWLQGYGLVVVIEHGKGDMSLYGYNQSALVSAGSQVSAGQSVALVGNSGGQGTSSLYFEIRRQGQAVNPLPWLGR
ncbi:MAG: Murein hydrolase activator EnvC [Candidatus Erwinia impunctatus]|nr:Murein hydrolase activator EnvC [Culicoides impunctatus]